MTILYRISRWTGRPQVILFFAMLGVGDRALAIKLPSGFVHETVVEEFAGGSTLAFAPNGTLFVATQEGNVFTIEDGTLSDEAVLSLEVDANGEHGLTGMVFDPEFAQNGYLYVYYTALEPNIHQRVSRFTIREGQATDEKILIEADDARGSVFHSAGALAFGPDHKLYIGIGDNGGLPSGANAQNLTTLFGKVLRIDPDGTIPTDNPFFAASAGKEKAIWAVGLRNPYSFDFDRVSGRFLIGDVGSTKFEEINEGFAGKNYGWPQYEGPETARGFESPIFSYAHGPVTSTSEGCAIVGGAFYSPTTMTFPQTYAGKYFFADYCSNWIQALDLRTGNATVFATQLKANPTVLRLGPDGALYYMSKWNEGIFRIQYKPNPTR